MTVSSNTTVIVNAGESAAVTAGNNGAQIQITSFQIGSALITPTATMTGVTNLVYTGTSSQITYSANAGTATMTFFVNLPETVGPFSIGNIGLFLANGTMFSITALANLESKTATNTNVIPNITGNTRILAIPIVLENVQNLVNVTALFPNYASLPSVYTEAQLPSPVVAPYNAYEIEALSLTDAPAVALSNGTNWTYLYGILNTSDSAVVIPNLAAKGFAEGTAICWNGSNIVAWDPSVSSNTYIGVVGLNDLVYRNGIFTISSGTPYSVGAVYYCGVGSNAGILTTSPPLAANYFLQVGYGLTNNSLILNAQCSDQLFVLDEAVINIASLFSNINKVIAPYTIGTSDNNKVIQTSTGTINLPIASSITSGFQVLIQNVGPTSSIVTVNPNGTSVSLYSGNTTSNISLPNANGYIGDYIWLEYNGTNWKVNGGSPVILGAITLPQAQANFAALNGSSSQVFNAANATTVNQVPNLGQFSSTLALPGFQNLPNGFKMQFAVGNTVTPSGDGFSGQIQTITLQESFTKILAVMVGTNIASYTNIANGDVAWQEIVQNRTNNSVQVYCQLYTNPGGCSIFPTVIVIGY